MKRKNLLKFDPKQQIFCLVKIEFNRRNVQSHHAQQEAVEVLSSHIDIRSFARQMCLLSHNV